MLVNRIIIREIKYEDLSRGFLDVLENLIPPDIDLSTAKKILSTTQLNPLHKIFVAIDSSHNDLVVGTTTLFIEPKFINKGMKIAYIEDVSVRKGYQKMRIGSQLVNYATTRAISLEGCRKVILYCARETGLFYQKLGYKEEANTCIMTFEVQ